MKKIFLGILCLLLCFSLAACGSTSSTTITNLSNQLDETANTISSVQTVSPTELSNSNNSSTAQNALYKEESYKANILSRTAQIKNTLAQDISLSKTQASAVKELTDNLNRYTNSVAYSKNDLSSTVNSISSLSKNADKNSDKINAKLNRLTCNSNARACYYENILSTLQEIDQYLTSSSTDSQAAEEETEENTQFQPQQFYAEHTCPNCGFRMTETYYSYPNENLSFEEFSYRNYPPQENFSESNTLQDENIQNSINSQSENSVENARPPINPKLSGYNSNTINRAAYGYGMFGNGFYGSNAGYNTLGTNGTVNSYATPNGANTNFNTFGAGMGNGFGARFNPNRNTDTYAPLMRNVDTYKFSPKVYEGSDTLVEEATFLDNEQPQENLKNEKNIQNSSKKLQKNTDFLRKPPKNERLEDYEKLGEDNTIQQAENETPTFNKIKSVNAEALAEDELDQPIHAH